MAWLAKVIVMPRPGVLDPQGQAVRGALATLGYAGIRDVRVGKYVELRLDTEAEAGTVREQVEDMCRRLLANPVIEEFRVVVEPDPASGVPAAGAGTAGAAPAAGTGGSRP